MKYVNSDTGVENELTGLTEEKTKFYRQALEKFRKNVDWLVFEEFVFGPMSPLYSERKSRLGGVADPLYLALGGMRLQVRAQAGRGQENRGRKADDRPNSARDRHLATTRASGPMRGWSGSRSRPG